MTQWRLWLRKATRRIWFRAAMISLLAVILALASAVLAPFIPYEFSLKIGSEAVDRILQILASSMLAVTTFSLTAMVLAYSRAAQNINPRATELLVEDKTAQNALSSFLGAFLFSIVGIIAVSTGLYGAQGRVILYVGTILLILWIVFILLRWIAVLVEFGRVEDAIKRVETAATKAIDGWEGPIVAEPLRFEPPAGAIPIKSDRNGYVISISHEACGRCADEAGTQVHIAAPPGERVEEGWPLVWSTANVNEKVAKRLANTFVVERQRTFENDPHFAMTVLSEIASRALSPAINDPGTANAVLDAGQRILNSLADPKRKGAKRDRVTSPPLSIVEMASDLVLPVARDAARFAEVGVRLQQLLGSLARRIPQTEAAARRLAADALERARDSGMADTDVARVERAFSEAFA